MIFAPPPGDVPSAARLGWRMRPRCDAFAQRERKQRRRTVTRGAWVVAAMFLFVVEPAAATDGNAFDGEWRTSFGIVTLKQAGDAVTGMYGDGGKFSIKGTVDRKKL